MFFASHCANLWAEAAIAVAEWTTQLLNLAARHADHHTNVAAWLCVAQCPGQLLPAHQKPRAHPRGTAPHVLSVILHRASLGAGRRSGEITQTRCSQAQGLFRCPSEECSNDGMQNYTTLSDFSQIRTIGHVLHRDVWKTDAPHSSGYLNVGGWLLFSCS